MDTTAQVILVFKLILVLGPLSVYFVGLGLVNSHAVPRLVNARTDFLALAVVFCPFLVWPASTLVGPLSWIFLPMLLVGAFLMLYFTRNLDKDWVVYNLSGVSLQRLIDRCCQDMSWDISWEGTTATLSKPNVQLRLSSLPLLRNVSVHVEVHDEQSREAADRLRNQVESLLETQGCLPSATGVGLVLVGAALMMIPLWMVSRHGGAIAEVLNQMFVG